ncbi:MAG: TRAP transporter fused permease subunit [Rhodospirillaceae bacterium]|jgi:TRAP transporter 4TM/12TM fusion protein|nr:TRAP transporter fused permease subunit [Rhodospirillaceae bacterium]MBT5768661.1 TRAP transporter fused permease subunit [Rhodospirillaceae bacterium]MBT6311447.1 TRAP transporter fused permease subunit [Rhodospirillaceae bacterium]MBT6537689.1 TRAP transporter fused permease subunit [Rhodospirillaceae bacterium]MBT7363825.1 TRAP transporter fused permease subunit [Rhodospirillaceae bacterium]
MIDAVAIEIEPEEPVSGFRAGVVDFDYSLARPGRYGLTLIAICAFGLWHVGTNLLWNEPGLWQNAIHYGGFGFLGFVTSATFKRHAEKPWSIGLDLVLGILVAASAAWIAGAETGLYTRTLAETGLPWQFTPIDWAAGIILIVAAIELTRRMTGWIIPVLVVVSLSYILFLGEILPGVFRAASLPLSDVLFRSLYNDEGMLGIIATISSANITLFMIFGAFLVVSGASDFVIELSKIIAGRFRGGAAFVAIISSALTGTISGSAVANTASTGIITIPLMKANGFRAKFAAGVEASASTGGQMMPPIMGAGAFVMVSFTGIAYSTIVIVSIIPAILYFMSVGFMVRVESMKHRIGTEQIAAVDWKKLWGGALNFVLPLGIMTYMLVSGRTPSFAACFAIGTLIVVSWVTPNRMGPRKISRALVLGIKTSIMTAVLLVTVGLINNAVTTSGLGNGFALMIAQWSQGSVLIAVILIAIVSLVLGMGLPVTAAYIVLSILSAPALAGLLADGILVEMLVNGIADPAQAAMFALVDSPHVANITQGMSLEAAKELVSGMPFELALVIRPALIDTETLTVFLLTAHLIVFWLSQDSNVTPPVCLAAFTAAGIAKSPPMATGVEAWKIAKGLYIVVLLFAFTPLIGAGLWESIQIGGFALFGIYSLTALIQRYSEGPIPIWLYPVFVAGGALCFIPLNLPLNVAGALLVSGCVVFTSRAARRARVVSTG